MTQDRTRPDGAAQASLARTARRFRLGLFLPYVLLALIVIAWSAGWFWLRGRAATEIDGWMAREAAAGRAAAPTPPAVVIAVATETCPCPKPCVSLTARLARRPFRKA